MTTRPRVYVVDDDDQMRRTMTRLLGAEYDVMCFATAAHFLEVAAVLPAGCLLLDVRMPEIDGLELQRRLAEKKLHFPTIMMTGLGDIHTAVTAMKAGAVDFVEKPFRREAIEESVRQAQQHLTPPVAGLADNTAAKERAATLSAREVEVLTGLISGLPNKTIAYDLGLSPRTVEAHRARIMEKMQARNFSALVQLALAAGIQRKP